MIEIIDRQKKHRVRKAALKRLIAALVARYRLGDPDIAVALVGSAAIRTLNRRFRKKDKPTDVLSFAIGRVGPDGRFYLGDIILAVPVAARQAREKGHSLERELEILAVHGFLHLVGYDHGRDMGEQERLAEGLIRR